MQIDLLDGAIRVHELGVTKAVVLISNFGGKLTLHGLEGSGDVVAMACLMRYLQRLARHQPIAAWVDGDRPSIVKAYKRFGMKTKATVMESELH
jgi:signal recognition particle GTPase